MVSRISGHCKPLIEGYEDIDDDSDVDIEFEGSLRSTKLRILNKQASRALESYRKSNPYQSAMAYYYYQQNLLLGNIGPKDTAPTERIMTITKEASKRQPSAKSRLPRPRYVSEYDTCTIFCSYSIFITVSLVYRVFSYNVCR